MKLSELPKDIRDKLISERLELVRKWKKNDKYNIVLTNKEGTRYFTAYRTNDFDGYGSHGSCWTIAYGEIQWKKCVNHLGFGFPDKITYEWVFGRKFAKSWNSVDIPKYIEKKKDIIPLIEKLEIFEI